MHEMANRTVEKTYVARVVGEFPEGEIVCCEPIETISHKLSINMVSPNGKECKTNFKKLSFNGRTSLVECRPETGRTHQIRGKFKSNTQFTFSFWVIPSLMIQFTAVKRRLVTSRVELLKIKKMLSNPFSKRQTDIVSKKQTWKPSTVLIVMSRSEIQRRTS